MFDPFIGSTAGIEGGGMLRADLRFISHPASNGMTSSIDAKRFSGNSAQRLRREEATNAAKVNTTAEGIFQTFLSHS
jgi:hypothetical protein